MADRYWVGGSGQWNNTNTTNWSATSGGAGGASVPTAVDNVYFDGNSDAGSAFSVDVSGGTPACRDLIIGDGATVTVLDQTMTLSGNSGVTIAGSLYFPAAQFTRTWTGGPTFTATTTGNTVTTNGASLAGHIVFNGAGGAWTLGSALSAGDLSVNQGTFNTNNYNMTLQRFYSSSTTVRAVNLGSSTITTNPDGSRWEIGGTIANLTLNAGTSRLVINRSGGSTCLFYGGGKTYYDVEFNTQGVKEIYDNNTFRNITLRVDSNQSIRFDFRGANTIEQITTSGGTSVSVLQLRAVNNITSVVLGTNWRLLTEAAQTMGALTIGSGGATIRVAMLLGGNLTVGTLSLQAANTDPLVRALVYSDSIGTPRVITATSISIGVGIDFQDITAAGASAPWGLSALSAGDLKGNTGITFPAPKTVYWNLAGNQNWNATAWATTPTGTPAVANFPLAQDTAVITEAGAAGTITFNNNWNIGTLTFDDGVSPRTSAVGLTLGQAVNIHGDLKLSSGVSISDVQPVNFTGRGTQNITSVGKLFTSGMAVNAIGGTLVLQDNLTLATDRILTLSNGTININNFVLSCGLFRSQDITTTRQINFGASGKLNLTGNNATVIAMSNATNLTTVGSRRVELSYNGASGTRGIDILRVGVDMNASPLDVFVTAGSDSVNHISGNSFRILDFSGFSGVCSFSGPQIYGNLVISSAMTLSASATSVTFPPVIGTTQTITTAGKTFDFPVTKTGAGTLTFQDNLTMGATRVFTHLQGDVNLNGRVVTCQSWSSTNSNVRSIIFGAGQIIATGSSIMWDLNVSTNCTIVPGTGKIVLSNDTTAAREFRGGGIVTYPELVIGGDTSTSTTTISGANGFAKLSSTKTVAHTIVFPNAETRVANWNLNGSAGNLITLSRTGGSGTFTIRYTGGSFALGRYLSISNSTALPINRMYAIYSTNGGGNTNWTFDSPKFAQFINFFDIV